MIQVLEQAIENIRKLSVDQQVYAAEILKLFSDHTKDAPLTQDEIEGIKHAQSQVRRGDYADGAVASFYTRFGL